MIKKKIGIDGMSLFGTDAVHEIIFQKKENMSRVKREAIKHSAPMILHNRIRNPEYWKVMQERRAQKVSQ